MTSDRARRKADQHWEMAGLARQDGDSVDAARHTRLARAWAETNGDAAEAAARAAAAKLQGTCDALETTDEYEEHGDNLIFCEEFDRLVYLCVGCEWWHSKFDHNHDAPTGWRCDECQRDEEDEE